MSGAPALVGLLLEIGNDVGECRDDFGAVHLGLAEAKAEVEALRGRNVLERERFGSSRFGFRGNGSGLFSRGGASAGQRLEQCDHFLRVALSNNLK